MSGPDSKIGEEHDHARTVGQHLKQAESGCKAGRPSRAGMRRRTAASERPTNPSWNAGYQMLPSTNFAAHGGPDVWYTPHTAPAKKCQRASGQRPQRERPKDFQWSGCLVPEPPKP